MDILPQKFYSITVPSNTIILLDCYKKQYITFGTTYLIKFRIDLPEYMNMVFICKINTKDKQKNMELYGKSNSDTIGQLADFVEIQRTQFRNWIMNKDMILIQSELVKQNKPIKIDSILLSKPLLQNNLTLKTIITGVKYTDTEIQIDLKKMGMYWNKELRYWEGNLSEEQSQLLIQKWGHSIIVTSKEQNLNESKMIIPIQNSNPTEIVYKVFNFATEKHISVPFTEIRQILMEHFHFPIIKLENKISVTKENINSIFEYKSEGRLFWVINQPNKLITEDEYHELFYTCIEIDSGDNTKRNSMKVLLKIQVGSCLNSIRVAVDTKIYHTENWKERFMSALQTVSQTLIDVYFLIQQSMSKEISLEEGIAYIEMQKYGLKDPEKIEHLHQILIQKFKIEYEHRNKIHTWDLSQLHTYIGTHTEETEEDFIHYEIGSNMYETLQNFGYNILLQ